jgi:hypothetical protein
MKFQSLTLKREGDLEKADGFLLEKEPFLSVLVGHPNRGDMYKRVGIGWKRTEELQSQERVMSGSFMKTHEKRTLLVIEEHLDYRPRVGMLLYAEPGFRGTSMISIRQYLAKGQIWDSPTGALGVGGVCLAIVQPGDVISVVRTGRLYGAHEEYFIRMDSSLNFHAMTTDEMNLEKEASEVKGEVL